MSKFVVFGGGGKVALKFASSAVKKGHSVIAIVRNDSHDEEIKSVGAQPHLLSLEEASVQDIVQLLDAEKPDGVVFSAGSGGKGGEERTKAVDYEGALKVFDAMESANVHRIVMVSATDLRDTSKGYPEYYNEASRKLSDRMYQAIPAYMKYKRLADLDLYARKSLRFTIIRPGGLTDEKTDGRCELGRPQLGKVPRETVGEVILATMLNKGSYGQVWDLMEGPTPIGEAVEQAVEGDLSSWHD